jgi:hypothetical protein
VVEATPIATLDATTAATLPRNVLGPSPCHQRRVGCAGSFCPSDRLLFDFDGARDCVEDWFVVDSFARIRTPVCAPTIGRLSRRLA